MTNQEVLNKIILKVNQINSLLDACKNTEVSKNYDVSPEQLEQISGKFMSEIEKAKTLFTVAMEVSIPTLNSISNV